MLEMETSFKLSKIRSISYTCECDKLTFKIELDNTVIEYSFKAWTHKLTKECDDTGGCQVFKRSGTICHYSEGYNNKASDYWTFYLDYKDHLNNKDHLDKNDSLEIGIYYNRDKKDKDKEFRIVTLIEMYCDYIDLMRYFETPTRLPKDLMDGILNCLKYNTTADELSEAIFDLSICIDNYKGKITKLKKFLAIIFNKEFKYTYQHEGTAAKCEFCRDY